MPPNINLPQLILAESFTGLVWKVMLHGSGLLAVETRNKDPKQVLFSAFNYISGETYFKEQGFEESWNLSLAFAAEQNLILIGYENSDTPQSKGILSVHIENGKTFWQKFNISLNQAQDKALHVYDSRHQPKKYYWIDHLTGEVVAEPSPAEDCTNVIFPETDNTFEIPSFIEHGSLAGELSVLNFSDKVFLSFHETDLGYFKQRLVVYQHDKILIDEILISGIQKLQPEAFFIQKNHLFYIRGKEEIVTYLV